MYQSPQQSIQTTVFLFIVSRHWIAALTTPPQGPPHILYLRGSAGRRRVTTGGGTCLLIGLVLEEGYQAGEFFVRLEQGVLHLEGGGRLGGERTVLCTNNDSNNINNIVSNKKHQERKRQPIGTRP